MISGQGPHGRANERLQVTARAGKSHPEFGDPGHCSHRAARACSSCDVALAAHPSHSKDGQLLGLTQIITAFFRVRASSLAAVRRIRPAAHHMDVIGVDHNQASRLVVRELQQGGVVGGGERLTPRPRSAGHRCRGRNRFSSRIANPRSSRASANSLRFFSPPENLVDVALQTRGSICATFQPLTGPIFKGERVKVSLASCSGGHWWPPQKFEIAYARNLNGNTETKDRPIRAAARDRAPADPAAERTEPAVNVVGRVPGQHLGRGCFAAAVAVQSQRGYLLP